MKITVLFGSFNPLTNAHVEAMKTAVNSIGADAVVNIRYASSAIMQGTAEVIAYGTAVKFV